MQKLSIVWVLSASAPVLSLDLGINYMKTFIISVCVALFFVVAAPAEAYHDRTYTYTYNDRDELISYILELIADQQHNGGYYYYNNNHS
ncbi:MAG: hypothetical protein AAFO91_18360, partial [Bacteroidota bacterium]